jgi:hypothetical protein
VTDSGSKDRWGCPDWRDSAAYESLSDLDEDWRWKWEFLRRTPAYRKIWQGYGHHGSASMALYAMAEDGVQTRFTRDYGITYPLNPEWDAQTIESNPFNDPTGHVIYHSSWWDDPSVSDEEAGFKALEFAKYDINKMEWGYVTVEFDLNIPLDQQLNRAKGSLEQARDIYDLKFKQLKSRRRDAWPRHLRVIDAKDQDASHQEIYAQFAEEDSDGNEDILDEFYRWGKQPKALVSQWHKQAVEVMEKASRFL